MNPLTDIEKGWGGSVLGVTVNLLLCDREYRGTVTLYVDTIFLLFSIHIKLLPPEMGSTKATNFSLILFVLETTVRKGNTCVELTTFDLLNGSQDIVLRVLLVSLPF